jgi:hypothetical protein
MSAAKILAVDRLEARIAPFDWAFAKSRSDEIDAHWRGETDANPALYDGAMLLAHTLRERRDADGGATLLIEFFETRFSRFLAWRDFGFPDTGVYNVFSMAAVRAADGAFLLGEMGPGHSSAGEIYFAAGTPDLSDVRGTHVDLDSSLVRELAEETGLAAQDGALQPGWTIVFDSQRVACMKIVDMPLGAAALETRARAFLAAEAKPELCAIHMISRDALLDDPRLPGFMRAFLAHAFA